MSKPSGMSTELFNMLQERKKLRAQVTELNVALKDMEESDQRETQKCNAKMQEMEAKKHLDDLHRQKQKNPQHWEGTNWTEETYVALLKEVKALEIVNSHLAQEVKKAQIEVMKKLKVVDEIRLYKMEKKRIENQMYHLKARMQVASYELDECRNSCVEARNQCSDLVAMRRKWNKMEKKLRDEFRHHKRRNDEVIPELEAAYPHNDPSKILSWAKRCRDVLGDPCDYPEKFQALADAMYDDPTYKKMCQTHRSHVLNSSRRSCDTFDPFDGSSVDDMLLQCRLTIARLLEVSGARDVNDIVRTYFLREIEIHRRFQEGVQLYDEIEALFVRCNGLKEETKRVIQAKKEKRQALKQELLEKEKAEMEAEGAKLEELKDVLLELRESVKLEPFRSILRPSLLYDIPFYLKTFEDYITALLARDKSDQTA